MSERCPANAHDERCVLVLAPTGRDSEVICRTLSEAGVKTLPCNNVVELCDSIRSGVGAAIIAAEALGPEVIGKLAVTLMEQPPWSDIPIILLATPAKSVRNLEKILADLGPTGTATVLERPLHVFSMVDRKSTRLNSSHTIQSRMPSSA